MSTAVGARTVAAVPHPSDLFLAQLREARERLLLLDYDGTIAPFTSQRHRAVPYASIPELLDCIMSTCRTRVALITGRAAREIPPLLGLHPHPEIWGTYGAERLCADGRYVAGEVSQRAQFALAEAEAWLQSEGLGELVEMKPGALAVHWRGLKPAWADEVKATAYRLLAPLSAQFHLLLTEFDAGLELREAVRSKGDVVAALLAEHDLDAAVAYLGDDATDEDAFRALHGRGLTVLVRPTYRFTAAQTWIRPPEELVQFLTDWIRACGGDL